jgi:hypothetical protein
VTARTPEDESVVSALSAALEPYPWRRFTPELLARFVLAARDRQRLHALLGAVPGASVGSWTTLEAAPRDDVRAAPLVEFLVSHRWTELSLPALCRNLCEVLDR